MCVWRFITLVLIASGIDLYKTFIVCPSIIYDEVGFKNTVGLIGFGRFNAFNAALE